MNVESLVPVSMCGSSVVGPVDFLCSDVVWPGLVHKQVSAFRILIFDRSNANLSQKVYFVYAEAIRVHDNP